MGTTQHTSSCTDVKQLCVEADKTSRFSYISSSKSECNGRDRLVHYCPKSNDMELMSNDIINKSKASNRICSNCGSSSSGSAYIHARHDNDDAVENIYSEPHFSREVNMSVSEDNGTSASYTKVLSIRDNIQRIQTQICQPFIDNNFIAFRRGFCILVLLNVLFLLSHVVSLSYLYATKKQYKGDTCFECDMLSLLTQEDIYSFGVNQDANGLCCIKSATKFVALLIKGLPSQKDVDRNNILLNKLLARKRSAILIKGSKLSKTSIIWERCQMQIGNIYYNSRGVQIDVGGTYVLRSNIFFKIRSSSPTRRKLGYDVNIERENGKIRKLASVYRICYNCTDFEDSFTTQTLFQVPVDQKWTVFIEISEHNKQYVQQHHFHSLHVFEI